MERPITIGYVEGYADAVQTMHTMINHAIQRNGNNLLSAVNDIIGGMYKQHDEMRELTNLIKEQIMGAPDMFEEEACCQECADYDETQMIQDIIDVLPPNRFTVIIGGNNKGGM